MENQIESNELEIEVMEPIALHGEIEEGTNAVTFDNKDKANEVENKDDCGIQNMINIRRTKLHKVKSIFRDQLVQDGVIGKFDTTRVYQIWPSRNVFFLHGRIICGPDPRGLMLTTVSIVLSSWIFATYIGKDLPRHSTLVVTFSVILTFIVLVNLILVGTTDPGIIPRNDETDSEEVVTTAANNDGVRSKMVNINGVQMKLKYCRICRIFRPPRSSHCAICDNCVEKYDHHCPWIGHCIGLRNHRFYMAFVICGLIFYVYVFAFSCWRLHRMWKDGNGFIWMVKICPETLALTAFGFIAIGFLGPLAIYHVYLMAINETAYENLRQRYVGCGNPYDKGVTRNFKEALFVRLPPPKVNFRDEVTLT